MPKLLLKSTILKLCKLSTFPLSNFSGDSEVPTDEIRPINIYCLLQSFELKPFIFIYLPDYKNSNSKKINIILAPNIITEATTITTTIATPTSTAKTKTTAVKPALIQRLVSIEK